MCVNDPSNTFELNPKDKNFAVGNFTGIINGAHPRISKLTQSILKYATEVTNLKNKQQEQHRSATNNVHNTLYMYYTVKSLTFSVTNNLLEIFSIVQLV